MSGGRALAILAAVVAAAVGVGLWFALQDEGSGGGSAPPADVAADGGAAGGAASPDKGTARRRSKVAGSAVVTGVVRRRSTRAPEVGCTVQLLRDGFDAWSEETDASGAFRLDSLPDGGPYEIRVEREGFATVRLPGLGLGRGETRDAGTLWLDRAVRLPVSVRDWSDRPIAGATVAAYTAPDYGDDFDWSKAWAQMAIEPVAVATVTTGADGSAVFEELASGTWTFVGSDAAHARGEAREVELRGGDDPPPVVIRLGAGNELAGRVLDADGAAVPDALVLGGANGNAWDVGASAGRSRAVTDAEGRWKLTGLATGDVALFVARPGGIPSWRVTVRVPGVRTYDLVLRAVGAIEGVVTAKGDGGPVEGATVRASRWSGSLESAETTTDADGRWRIEAFPEGPVHEIVAEKDGWAFVPPNANAVWGMSELRVRAGGTLHHDLVLLKGATVSGTVTCDGAAVDGAKVVLRLGSPTLGVLCTRTAQTDAAGRWSVAGVPPGSAFAEARKDGFWQPEWPRDNWWSLVQNETDVPAVRVRVPEAGEATLDLVLRRGAVVRGRVEGPDGPVAGALVATDGHSTRSGADGAFTIEGVVPAPSARVVATAEGLVQSETCEVAIPDGAPAEEVVVRLSAMPVVRGRITTADGRPLAEPRVRVLFAPASANGIADPAGEEESSPPTTDVPVAAVLPDGTYESRIGWVRGAFFVMAEDPGRGAGSSGPQLLEPGVREYVVDVPLTAVGSVRGRVVSGGVGVAGADVRIVEHEEDEADFVVFGGGGGGDESAVQAVTDASGSFEAPGVAPGEWDVKARARGFVSGGQSGVRVPGAPDVRIELGRELTLSGVVVLPDGTGVNGVQVRAVAEGTDDESFGPVWMEDEGDEGHVTVTAADGSFTVRALAGGNWKLHVAPTWMGTANVRPVVAGPFAAGLSDLRVIVQPGRRITGRVTDEEDRPIEGAWITVSREGSVGAENMDPDQFRGTTTHADGAFDLVGLGGGTYTLHVQTPSVTHQTVSRQGVAAGTTDLVIRLPAALTIEGVVTGLDGKPVQGAEVAAARIPQEGDEPTDGPVISFGGQTGTTDAEGRFRVGGLAPGRYKLSAPTWTMHERKFVLLGGDDVAAGRTDVRLTADPGLRLSGVVVDESGRPVAGAQVQAVGESEWYQPLETDAAGRFALGALREGKKLQLTVTADGYATTTVRDLAAGSSDVSVVLRKGLSVSGRLVDAAGKPVPNVYVWFTQEPAAGADEPAPTTLQFASRINANTDAQGRFRADGFAEGTWIARCPAGSGDGEPDAVVGTVRAGATDVELRLPK